MKAIVHTKYGTPEVLQVKQVAKPIPGNNEVLIKVHAVEVTKADCELRSFKFPVKWFWLPLRMVMGVRRPKRTILGGYFSGEIEQVGKEVTKFNQGDKVFGVTGLSMGAYAEYICSSIDNTMIALPDNMNYQQAAAVPLGGLNALHFLKKANIQSGEKVLINGAGGSIGLFAVQIAKTMGGEVTAVDSAIKENMLRRIGADHFIDYNKESFADKDQKYDVIFDMVAHSSYTQCIKTLNRKGRYLMGNPRFSDMLRSVITPLLTDKKVFFAFAGEKEEELYLLKAMIEADQIEAVVDKVFTMEEARQAHERVETEQRIGSVVISISGYS
ncbi:NAD(P)-dependent alcohol dehydrogenase [Aliikangiella sp. IMCC44359]|uniref:NAD(P)-dependent alcohol dehydrogenase n=1 Tax=Aliikangiella sp. IMCC44359 TaxID=3459125 RepID=UPI00403AD827